MGPQTGPMGPGPDGFLINFAGEKIALGPLRRDLLSSYHTWSNDFAATVTFGTLRPMTREATEAWFERLSKENEREIAFTVYERATKRPIGITALYNLDRINRTASYYILIGEKACWGKGYGTETTRLMLDYGFNVQGFHNIMLTVFSYNQRGIRAYLRAGFRIMGCQREAHRFAEQTYDIVYMDCLSSEFQGSVLVGLLPRQ